jgi:hypothetical protein
MDDQGIMVRLPVDWGGTDLSLPQDVQTGSGTQSAFYLTRTEFPSPTGKATVRETNHILIFST